MRARSDARRTRHSYELKQGTAQLIFSIETFIGMLHRCAE